PQLLEWKDAVIANSFSGGEEQQEVFAVVRPKVQRYFAERIAELRDDPDPAPESLMTQLIGGSLGGERPLTDSEALRYCILLFMAGLDTVTESLVLGMLWLARHPEERARVAADKSLIPGAVEELLRLNSVTTIGRKVTRDVKVRDVQMRAGDFV